MERLGKINKIDIFYLHWDDPKRDFYLDWLPDKIYALFAVGDDANRRDDYKKMASIFLNKNVIWLKTAGKENELIHDLYDSVVIDNELSNGRDHTHPNFLKDKAITDFYDEFGEGFWASTWLVDHEPLDVILCIDFTERRVRDYLKILTKIIRKGWGPRSRFYWISAPKESTYNDEIKKPLRKSQKGFEKD